jgi:hypothetical protein
MSLALSLWQTSLRRVVKQAKKRSEMVKLRRRSYES